MRIRRKNTAWLLIMGLLLLLVILSGAAAPAVTAALGVIYLAALLASVLEFQPRASLGAVRSSPLKRMRMSTEAREAADRARRRGEFFYDDLTLIDIGLISSHSSPDGMVMRKGRSISGDDDGVRPFITLQVEPSAADRHAMIRFEIIDHHGVVQYVHEMRTYLRDGEMNILADHHLPLVSNDQIGQGGDWDLRVSVDNTLAGILSFAVTPSLVQREQSFSRLEAREAEPDNLSLEDLMRGQQRRNQR